MGLLTSNVSRFRNHPQLLQLPPYLALLCILGGIIWILLLPLDEYSRRTYISENALLPGQVHTYFHGSDQNIFRGYLHEVSGVLNSKAIEDENGNPTGQFLVATESHKIQKFESIWKDAGLKIARQKYEYESGGQIFKGENIYTIVHGPRADGTESVVLVAPMKNIQGNDNVRGVTLLLTLARYLSRWSLWSKDIILVVTPDTFAGPQAFVDAYHSMHDSSKVADLSLKSGHIQGAVVIDYPLDHNFETLHIAYDGVNGQLPNLDLINTAIQIITEQMGIRSTIQSQHDYSRFEDHGHYLVRLKTLGRGMLNQALGHSTGAHSVFMSYHIDAITLTAVGHGWQDEMAFGRTVESIVRSLNNLLEKLHQSFFFYLLLQNVRFVSIGTYLPSAMAIGAGYTIIAIFGWVMSGYEKVDTIAGEETAENPDTVTGKPNNSEAKEKAKPSKTTWKTIDRPLAVPTAIVATLHLSSMLSIFVLANIRSENLLRIAILRSALAFTIPVVLATTLQRYNSRTVNTISSPKSNTADISDESSTASTPEAHTKQVYTLLTSLSLLILGLELTVLATLNFSLSMIIGLLCSPLAFVGYIPSSSSSSSSTQSPSIATASTSKSTFTTIKTVLSLLLLILFSPPAITVLATAADLYYYETFRAPVGMLGRIREFLEEEAFAFNILGAWGVNVGVWAIWVPAWIVGATGVWASLISNVGGSSSSVSGAGAKSSAKNVVDISMTKSSISPKVASGSGGAKGKGKIK